VFSDTCGEQNRNENIAAELLYAVQSIYHINVIEQKFQEKGTTWSAVCATALSVTSRCAT